MNCMNYLSETDTSGYRVTVDTPEDFEVVTRIFQGLKERDVISYQDVIGLLKRHPDIAAINSGVEQKVMNA
jgi:spore coat polysaccharide biosynthesis protein SpsF